MGSEGGFNADKFKGSQKEKMQRGAGRETKKKSRKQKRRKDRTRRREKCKPKTAKALDGPDDGHAKRAGKKS